MARDKGHNMRSAYRRRNWKHSLSRLFLLAAVPLFWSPAVPHSFDVVISTEITGEGGSAAPQNDALIRADQSTYDHYHITPDWRTFQQYFSRLEKQGMGINLASFVGATQVRRMVLGDDDKQPTLAQLE